MKNSTSSLELHCLVKEWKGLEGCRINKIYHKGSEFLFDLHKSGEGKKQLRLILPNFMFLTKYKPEFLQTPPKFCMFLRKRLGGGFIRKVSQHGFDRIVDIEIEAGEKHTLVIELFSKGNLVLCDKDMKIISPFQGQNWEARTIRGGTDYKYPPSQVNPKEMKFDDFWQVLEQSEMDSVVKALAVDFGLGGVYAEEACARAGVDKDAKPKTAEEETAKRLFDALGEMLEMEIKANSDGEVFPFTMETKPSEKHYDSFNEAVDEVVSRKVVSKKADVLEDVKQEKIEKVEKVIRNQEETIAKLERDSKENQRKAEMIFENYQEISQLLYELQQDKKNLSWDELKEKYKGHALVKQINDKEGLVVVEI